MAPTVPSLASLASLLAVLPSALAGFNAGGADNIAVYWGQNSFGQIGSQGRLSQYCQSADVDIIPLAFMNGITPPITNFASASDSCTAFADNPNLLQCPEIEADIKTCQSTYGKTIVISLGGATYTQGGWSSTSAAESAAQSVFDMFGPVKSGVDRPFGSAVVDGFDFDFEATTNNLPAFGAKLRSLMDGAGGKKFYLTAAPQCVFPDAAVGTTLDAVAFDVVMIQFYNNYCGTINFTPGTTTQNAYNIDVWDKWAKGSKNPNVKLLVGIPANTGAGGGYTEGSKLAAALDYSKQFTNFGGVMMWDMSQLYANNGFLAEVVSDLAGGPSTPPPTTTSKAGPGPTGNPPSSGGDVAQWGQCGGIGYTGSTTCQAPYKCVNGGAYWSSCQ